MFANAKQTLISLLSRLAGSSAGPPGGRIRFRTAEDREVFADNVQLPANLLGEAESLRATEWLRQSMTRFAYPVSAFIPGHFQAYARIHHPFDRGGESSAEERAASTWKAVVGEIPDDPAEVFDIAMAGSAGHGQARVGCLPRYVVNVLASRLAASTSTPDECYFAVWAGYGDLRFSPRHPPTLQLPQREYHVFAGPLAKVGTGSGYSDIPWDFRSPNLWWPADHAWCVASEIDHAWTYVAGSRELIDDILRDSRLESVETTAGAEW